MIVLSILVKATFVLALMFGLLRCVRQSSAAVRALLLATTFPILLAIPLASIVFPPVDVVVFRAKAAVTSAAARATSAGLPPKVTLVESSPDSSNRPSLSVVFRAMLLAV